MRAKLTPNSAGDMALVNRDSKVWPDRLRIEAGQQVYRRAKCLHYGEGWKERTCEVGGKDKGLKPNSHQASRAVRRFTLIIHFYVQIRALTNLGHVDRCPDVCIIGMGE